MKSKKIISGLLALSLVFGGAVVPSAVVGNSVISASASDIFDDNFGGLYAVSFISEDNHYCYYIFKDGTVYLFAIQGLYDDTGEWHKYDEEMVMPSEIDGKAVTCIGYAAVGTNSIVKKITVPEGITMIDNGAFQSSYSLESIDLPDTVTYIGDYAFECDEKLKSFKIPPKVTTINNLTFMGCKSLTSVSIPDGVTSIGDYAFELCESLPSVNIPDSVTSIGDGCFHGCVNLRSIVIPASVTSIGVNAFVADYKSYDLLKNLTIYCYKGSYAEKYAEDNGLNYGLIDGVSQGLIYNKLDDNTIEIMKYVGNDTEVNIPSKIDNVPVTSIHSGAFSGSNTIKSVVIPDSVVSMGAGAFNGCTNLESVSLSNNVRSIGYAVFSECPSLKEIVIPDSVTSIDTAAFVECIGLEKVYLSNNLETIGSSAFNGCKSLKEIVIPDSVISIEAAAFADCTGLESVTIPNSVVSISDHAFVGCDNLTIYTTKKSNSIILDPTVYSDLKYNGSGELSVLKSKGEASFGDFVYKVDDGSYTSNPTVSQAGSHTLYYKVEETDDYYGISEHSIEFNVEKAEPLATYPTNIKVEYNEQYHQVRFTWDKVENAEKYGIAVYLAGKWRIQTQNITGTIYTTPKNLTPGKTYKVAIAAKVNGQWDVNNAIKNAVTVTVK